MIQWFRGDLEASYVGTQNAQPFFGARPAATHYKLHVYRAALKNLEKVEPPAADEQPATESCFRQARVDDALIAGVRGPGTLYQGPVFELLVSAPHFSHALHKDGRAYGRLTGHALLYCELPPEPAQPAVPLTQVKAEPTTSEPIASDPLPAELRRTSAPESTTPSVETVDPAELQEVGKTSPPPAAAPRLRTSRSESAAPLFALAAAVAIGLWVSCGAPPALLWCLFILPTLVARKLFHGVLNDSPYIRGFGALLAITQLLCVFTLVSEWWSLPCKQLHVLPLIGIVAVIFPAGILPSVAPLAFNAAGLALVLAVWCGGGETCQPKEKPAPFAPASVEHPGVPRTNDDGTWPRRPPGR